MKLKALTTISYGGGRMAIPGTKSENFEIDEPHASNLIENGYAEKVGKADAPKADAAKADVPKADAAKADVPKADAAKADVPKADVAKADAKPDNDL